MICKVPGWIGILCCVTTISTFIFGAIALNAEHDCSTLYLDWHPVLLWDELLRFIVEQGQVVEQAKPDDKDCHSHHQYTTSSHDYV